MDFDENDYPMEEVKRAYAKERRHAAWRDFQLCFFGIAALWYFADDRYGHADFIAIFIFLYAIAVFIGRLMTAKF